MSLNKKLNNYEYNKVPLSNESNKEKQEEIPKYGYGFRHIQLVLVGICIMVSFMARGHMGVTIVAMVDQKASIELDGNVTIVLNVTSLEDVIDFDNLTLEDIELMIMMNDTKVNLTEGNVTDDGIMRFDWPKATQEMILGAFFMGYFIMTFPMGVFTQRFGGIIPLQIGLFINGAVSCATPWLTIWGGWKAVCACRLIQGLSQAGTFPSVQNLLANWVPVRERPSVISYVYAGSTIGTVVAFQLSGFLAETRWGWPGTFYAVGGLCFLNFALLTFFGVSSPTVHKTISEEEKNYIMGGIDTGSKKRIPTPWKRILSSKRAWAIFITHAGSGTAFVFFFVQVPTYIHCILGINVENSGILSSLPYIAAIITSVVFGVGNDFVINKGLISPQNARRISNSISQFGMSLALVCVSFTTSTTVAVSCLVVAMACHSGIHAGWMVNHIDLAPSFSGTLMAIGNVLTNLLIVLCPVLVSYVVTDVYNIVQWRIIFFIIAGLAFCCNLFFVTFVSIETQPWNYAQDIDIICVEDQVIDELKKSKEIK